MARRRIINKQFAKKTYRLPTTSFELARNYNAPPVNLRTVWYKRIALLSILIIIVLLIYSPLFKIRNVIVEATNSQLVTNKIEQLVKEYLGQRKFYILPQDNLLVFSPKACQQYLTQKMYLSSINFVRLWPGVLRVQVKENPVIAIWQAASGLYLLDKRGVAIDSISDRAQEPDLPLFKSSLGVVNIGNQVTSEQIITFLEKLLFDWQEFKMPSAIEYIEIKESDWPTLYIKTIDGWLVYVSSVTDAYDQVNLLKQVLEQKFKDDRSKIDYIDVRFVKAYIKSK